MRKHATAVHEAGHAVLGHYFGFEIKKLEFNRNADAEMEVAIGEKAREKPAVGLNYFLMLAGGNLAAFMDSGPETFWKRNPKSLLAKSHDMEAMKSFNFNLVSTKKELTRLLNDLHAFLAKPRYWGKVQHLADEFRDSPKGYLENDIGLTIGRCSREREPEYNPGELIEWMADELFSRS